MRSDNQKNNLENARKTRILQGNGIPVWMSDVALHTNKGLFSAVNSHMCFQMGSYITRVATLVTIVFFFALLGRGSRDRPSATSSQTAERFGLHSFFCIT